ncbi:hypothetical protein THAOC_07587 [Thalassiosira oceanica]|uniref:Uncharacterized protein n=1 Tax=Thalassiosira oceanica TaxID=159749 RepID=K0SZY5_THAOC|nr:hypothetical protein THAOC_07587 [Thalassiosira oceanica]|eukprot:EJK71010.1 hypothetical protein THAOC_07587 [Thalassiosira oceanica]
MSELRRRVRKNLPVTHHNARPDPPDHDELHPPRVDKRPPGRASAPPRTPRPPYTQLTSGSTSGAPKSHCRTNEHVGHVGRPIWRGVGDEEEDDPNVLGPAARAAQETRLSKYCPPTTDDLPSGFLEHPDLNRTGRGGLCLECEQSCLR